MLNLSKGEAKARADQAELLTPRWSLTGEQLPPTLPSTAAEPAAGAIGPTHVTVITATMRRIPPTAHPGTVAQAEETLAHAARRFDPAALGRIGERLIAYLDPDGTEPAEEPETVRELRVRQGSDGTVCLAGKLDPEGDAQVLEVLGSLNGRRAPVEGVPDQRSQARRDADALVEAMSRLLDEGQLPSRGGQRPQLVLTMKLSDLIEGVGTVPFPAATAHPAIARPITFSSGSTGARRNSIICACCVSTTMSLCTGKDGTSDSTVAGAPSSFLLRPWTPTCDRFTTHSGSSWPTWVAYSRCCLASPSIAGRRPPQGIITTSPRLSRSRSGPDGHRVRQGDKTQGCDEDRAA